MKLRLTCGLFLTTFLALIVGQQARAGSIEMGIYKSLDVDPEQNRCPTQVLLSEQSRPYFEGGYTIDGTANLSTIAEKFTLVAIDEFSVTWVATLKQPYRSCKATAGMLKVDGEEFQGSSYLRLKFMRGSVYLILDMTGMRDVNGFTTTIIRKGVRNGNPFWSWGGSD